MNKTLEDALSFVQQTASHLIHPQTPKILSPLSSNYVPTRLPSSDAEIAGQYQRGQISQPEADRLLNLNTPPTASVAATKVSNLQPPVQPVSDSFFNNTGNNPIQWLGKVAADIKQRGPAEGLHDLTYPFTKNPIIEPIIEPIISKIRVANFNAGRPNPAVNALLGQQDWQMATPSGVPAAKIAPTLLKPAVPKLTDQEVVDQYKQGKLTAEQADRLLNNIPAPTPAPTPPTETPSSPGGAIDQTRGDPQTVTQFKFKNIYDKYINQLGLDPSVVPLLVNSENRGENPTAPNKNDNGTLDIGVLQNNVAADNVAEIQRLQNPEYSIKKGLTKYATSLNLLGDPALAIAAYNLGDRGATKWPQGAMERIKWVYWRAGLPVPQTPFTTNPGGHIKQIEPTRWNKGVWSKAYGD